MSLETNGVIACVRCQKFRCEFVARTFALIAPKHYKTHQFMNLAPNGVDRVRSLRKTLTRFRDTNFCTSSARFALSFVRQPNGPKCTKIVRNTP